jgi:hypothetical protein
VLFDSNFIQIVIFVCIQLQRHHGHSGAVAESRPSSNGRLRHPNALPVAPRVSGVAYSNRPTNNAPRPNATDLPPQEYCDRNNPNSAQKSSAYKPVRT